MAGLPRPGGGRGHPPLPFRHESPERHRGGRQNASVFSLSPDFPANAPDTVPGVGDGGRAGLDTDAEADAGGIAAGDVGAEEETPAALPLIPANFRHIFPGVVLSMWEKRRPDGKLPSRKALLAEWSKAGMTVACADKISRWLVAANCVRIVQNGPGAGTYAICSVDKAFAAAQGALEGARKIGETERTTA